MNERFFTELCGKEFHTTNTLELSLVDSTNKLEDPTDK